MDQPLVTVICISYNHERFIARALDGFLAQKTTFPFEVFIHDDASTDSTADIIRDYEARFPDIIRAVYQVENQHSQGLRIFEDLVFPEARGKFVALCEGDDFWLDPLKLQKQVDYLEAHPDCSLCFHDAQVVDLEGRPQRRFFPEPGFKPRHFQKGEADYDAGGLIRLGFIPTQSLVFPRRFMFDWPSYHENGICGDLPLGLTLASRGYAHYLDEAMSAYRTGNPESMSGQTGGDFFRMARTVQGHVRILQDFDTLTGFKWHEDVEFDVRRRLFKLDLWAVNRFIQVSPGYKDFLQHEMATSTTLYLYAWSFRLMLRLFAPGALGLLKRLRSLLRWSP